MLQNLLTTAMVPRKVVLALFSVLDITGQGSFDKS